MLQNANAHALTFRDLPMGEQELRDRVCNYIMTINEDMALEQKWVVSAKPYPIVLSLKKTQRMLNKNEGIHDDCFNLVARKFAFEELEKLKGTNKIVSKHYMDLKFSILIPLQMVTA
ncbi:hypothetical protein BDA96_07G120400 [Sorghum bicolor]|uniref:Uncharacterized protein n=1 Tax=Sorghum bicolor TaxID=4558 RepID=A0A921QMI7_SORBI|nr:hypothetical protein BDA96_07G120400 [Sorghum bicolor]